MGGQHSKVATGGSLQGAYAPSVTNVPDANLPKKNAKKNFSVKVPTTLKGISDGTVKMTVTAGGSSHRINIPKGLKSGDKFSFAVSLPEVDRVFASTLPTVPGMEVVQAKPIIWGSVSYSFQAGSHNQQAMGNMVGRLMQDAQSKILEQVLEQKCNAVLGMTFNVTNDSSGDRGHQKLVIVTACGTPCVVLPTTSAVAIDADVVVETLYG